MLTVRLQTLNLAPGAWVLDLGCGEGRHVHGVHMIDGVNVIGLDLDLGALGKARHGLASLPGGDGASAVIAGDAYRLPFADHAFDAVICSEVLEHLADYRRVLNEIVRVLKPQGLFAPTVPRSWPERICWRLAPGSGGYADQPGGHVRIFDETALRGEVTGLGFRFLSQHYAHGLHTPYWWLKCAFWDRRDDHPLVRHYHRFLVWDLLERPWLTRALDAICTPMMGKSVALYFQREDTA